MMKEDHYMHECLSKTKFILEEHVYSMSNQIHYTIATKHIPILPFSTHSKPTVDP